MNAVLLDTPLSIQTADQMGRAVCIIVIALLLNGFGHAHDDGQWGDQDPATVEWYKNLMQPDAPTASCCGEADAYWADEVHVRNGKTYATITDDRPDEPRGRPHVDVGTEIEIPDNKLKWDRGNPTGHNILFIARGGWDKTHYVYCFVQGSGT